MRQENGRCSPATWPCVLVVLGVFFLNLCARGKVFQTCTVHSASLLSKQLGKKLLLASVSKLIPCLLVVSDYNELRDCLLVHA